MKVWSNAIPKDLCDRLITCYEGHAHQAIRTEVPGRVDSALYLRSVAPDMVKEFEPILLEKATEYFSTFNCPELIEDKMYKNITYKVQKSSKGEGFTAEHFEQTPNNPARFAVWMAYLNRTEDGHTIFPQQKTSVSPSTGKLVIWPAGYTHPHYADGLDSDKYTITGWFEYK